MAGAALPFLCPPEKIGATAHHERTGRTSPPGATAKYISQLRMLYYPQHFSPRARPGEDTGVIKYR
jgi:hypothetical protein